MVLLENFGPASRSGFEQAFYRSIQPTESQ